MTIDPHLAVRGGAVYLTAVATLVVWIWYRPSYREQVGALVGTAWQLPALLALNMLAHTAGWWRFDTDSGTLVGVPVDLWLGWAWIWGGLLPIVMRRTPVLWVLAAAALADVLVMPLAAPVVRLGPSWLVGEGVALAVGLAPGLLLARWTAAGLHLARRALLQIVTFAGLVLFVVPAAALDTTGWQWVAPGSRSAGTLGVALQVLAVPILLGLVAVHDFVVRGGGTPVPFDPPARLVTGGIYAYVRNPMQVSGVLLLVGAGVLVESVWVASAGVLAHGFAAGLAGWSEREDLRARFGDAWTAYRRRVPAWLPRWRPGLAPEAPPARLYVRAFCGPCSEIATWFAARRPAGLVIVTAGSPATCSLTRITYESGDGILVSSGVAAVGRALEHVHLGWALAGACLRLPALSAAIQLLVDASGGEPRPVIAVGRRCSRS